MSTRINKICPEFLAFIVLHVFIHKLKKTTKLRQKHNNPKSKHENCYIYS